VAQRRGEAHALALPAAHHGLAALAEAAALVDDLVEPGAVQLKYHHPADDLVVEHRRGQIGAGQTVLPVQLEIRDLGLQQGGGAVEYPGQSAVGVAAVVAADLVGAHQREQHLAVGGDQQHVPVARQRRVAGQERSQLPPHPRCPRRIGAGLAHRPLQLRHGAHHRRGAGQGGDVLLALPGVELQLRGLGVGKTS